MRMLDDLVLFDAGRVVVRTGKVELGQGIHAAIIGLAAAALDLSPDRIEVAPTRTVDSPNEGHTSGSLSVQTSGVAIARACSQARRVLLAAAAAELDAVPDVLTVEDGHFQLAGGDTGLDYWAFADRLAAIPLDAEAPLDLVAPASDSPRRDLLPRVTGAAFIHDIEPADMLHARIVRPPQHGASLVTVDIAGFRARHPDVEIVVDGSFLAVFGASEAAIVRATERLRDEAQWHLPAPVPAFDPIDRLGPETPPGEIEASLRNSLQRHSATYTRPAIAHGSIAPSCAIAWFRDERLEIWSHSQNIFALRDAIAQVLALEPATICVTHAPGSGCYGHNGADDVALDAALVARHAGGCPVRVQWSREEELAWSPVGPPMRVRIDASLSDEGRIADWTLELWTAPHARRPGVGGQANLLSATMLADPVPLGVASEIPLAFGGGGNRNSVAWYDLPDQRVIEHFVGDYPVRTSSLRALGAHANIFAIELMMDELAEQAGVDPLAFRLDHLADPRGRRVLEAAAAMSARTGPAPDGSARALAGARYKNTSGYAAIVAEVAIGETVEVRRIWCAADVGFAASPDGVRNQIEGGILQSISWLLHEAAPLGAHGVEARSWKDYPILRFAEVPRLEIELIESGDAPLGAGEIVQGPASAAVGNAVARALGLRIRDLPITRERIMRAAWD